MGIRIKDKHLEVEVKLEGQLDDVSEVVQGGFLSLQKKSKKQFVESEQVLLIIVKYVLGAVSSGFLEELGKELWERFKEIFIEGDEQQVVPDFKIQFDYADKSILAEIKADQFAKLEAAFKELEGILDNLEEDEDEVHFILKEDGWVRNN
ncbi:hypothetical protein MWH28_11550 [Natroniella sulfidigena]|uniref:hypothetical protein n=1 Tax=Natroniella sulfidigena TaxID=723921 RepID=UPI00200B2B7D|nr:hypothetical protein [Natroniella sulfidigena]MCK8817991.1 hypothetical protein [Natroniella sulfidigena]